MIVLALTKHGSSYHRFNCTYNPILFKCSQKRRNSRNSQFYCRQNPYNTSPYLFEWCCWAIRFSLPLLHWVIIVVFITPDWLINVLFTDSKWTFRRHWCSRSNYSKGKRELVLNGQKCYNELNLLCLNVAGNPKLVKAYIIWHLNNDR